MKIGICVGSSLYRLTLSEIIGKRFAIVFAYATTAELPDEVSTDVFLILHLDAVGSDLKQLKPLFPRVVLLASDPRDPRLFPLVKAGLQAILNESEATPEALVTALHDLSLNKPTVPDELSIRMFRGANFGQLTAREKEVLAWVAVGESDAAIGTVLTISEYSVKKHIKSILEKLRARNRTEAAVRGVLIGVCDQPGISHIYH